MLGIWEIVDGGPYSTWEEFVGRVVVAKDRGSWLRFEVTEFFRAFDI